MINFHVQLQALSHFKWRLIEHLYILFMKTQLLLFLLLLFNAAAQAVTDVGTGQTGIIESGTVQISSFTPSPVTTAITFNNVYTTVPHFSFGLAGFEMSASQIYKILTTSNVQNQKASVTWDVSPSVRKVNIRYIASGNFPLRLALFTSKNVADGVSISNSLPNFFPSFGSIWDLSQGTIISGFEYNNVDTTTELLLKLSTPDVKNYIKI